MTVSVRYILAAIALGAAALCAAPASADCNSCQPPAPPPCHSCNPPPPCHACTPPTVVVPPPNVPPPNIVVVNAGARAQAQASATAIAIANANNSGTVIVRNNTIVDGGAQASVQSSAFAVTEASAAVESTTRERMLLIQAICLDTTNNPHPASQVFGGRDVAEGYIGELYRCMSGTRMRYTIDGRNYDCAAGEALWYENAQARCKTQIERRPCNERSLLRRFGPGDKMVRIRETETHEARRETTFNGAMTMDGGVGQSVW